MLIAAIQIHLDRLDLSDESSPWLLHRRFVAASTAIRGELVPASSLANLGPPASSPHLPPISGLPIDLKREPRPLCVMPPLAAWRDGIVEVTEEGDLLADELYVNDPELNHVPVEPGAAPLLPRLDGRRRRRPS